MDSLAAERGKVSRRERKRFSENACELYGRDRVENDTESSVSDNVALGTVTSAGSSRGISASLLKCVSTAQYFSEH